MDVCFTPGEYCGRNKGAHNAIVIDVLRATTSIATAFYHGCSRFIPVETIETAVDLKSVRYPDALLAGERGAMRIPGFDLGNSPFEYKPDVVAGKTIIMTTTNGTVALHAAAAARKTYTAAFVNAGAVCQKILDEEQDVIIVCAGTQGQFALEDALCAGLIADRLSYKAALGDTALAVQAMYQDFSHDLLNRIKDSSHASRLIRIGFEKDLSLCFQHDLYPIVPEFTDGMITI
jgi:2-phosphosulfolactate phosphatase